MTAYDPRRHQHAARFETNVARDEYVSDSDIHASRLTGMAPADVDRLKDASWDEHLLIVVRCPKRPARYHHGKIPAKPMATKIKSDPATGVVTLADGQKQVSDYDLMCIYRFVGDGAYEKIDIAKADTPIIHKLNFKYDLKSEFQHGGQDDYHAPDGKHPNVKLQSEARRKGEIPDRFAVFNLGAFGYHPDPESLKRDVYDRFNLNWPYDADGKHVSATA